MDEKTEQIEIKLDGENAREHPPENQELIRASLEEFGPGRSILIDGDGRIIAGNETYRQAAALGLPVRIVEAGPDELIAVHRPDLTGRASVRLGIIDNRASDLSHYSAESLLFLANKYGEETIKDGVFTEAEWRALIREEQKNKQPKELKEDGDIDPAEAWLKKWEVQPGQLWQLGTHRLLCGDSTDVAQVEFILQGDRADLSFTDPPYGISYQGKGGQSIAGDTTYAVIPVMFAMMKEHCLKPKAWIYVCGGQVNVGLYTKMMEYHFRAVPRIVVWDKMAMIMRHNGYHSAYEFIYYCNTEGAGNLWFGDRAGEAATDIWRVPKPNQTERTHLTEKPVELPSRAINNSCPPGGIVWEPFAGTGSTLLACEKHQRIGRGVEYSPTYAATILERFQTATGVQPVLIDYLPPQPQLGEKTDGGNE